MDDTNSVAWRNGPAITCACWRRVQGPAAQLFKFVADPPTTTMQRLRGILTVPLPPDP